VVLIVSCDGVGCLCCVDCVGGRKGMAGVGWGASSPRGDRTSPTSRQSHHNHITAPPSTSAVSVCSVLIHASFCVVGRVQYQACGPCQPHHNLALHPLHPCLSVSLPCADRCLCVVVWLPSRQMVPAFEPEAALTFYSAFLKHQLPK
jgi:hypothetical protein